jgi:hypothetical protein
MDTVVRQKQDIYWPKLVSRRRRKYQIITLVTIFSINMVRRASLRSTQLPIQLVPGDPSSKGNRPGREAVHQAPRSAELNECVKLHLHLPHILHGAVLSYTQGQLHVYLRPGKNIIRSLLANVRQYECPSLENQLLSF